MAELRVGSLLPHSVFVMKYKIDDRDRVSDSCGNLVIMTRGDAHGLGLTLHHTSVQFRQAFGEVLEIVNYNMS